METLQATKFTLSQIRKIYSQCEKEAINFRDFLTFVTENHHTPAEIMLMLKSIKEGFCTFEEIQREEVIYDETGYYDYDNYTTTREGDIRHTDDVNFCSYFEEYTSEELEKCFIGRNEQYYCQSAVDREGLDYYNGAYYDTEAMEHYDLVSMDSGEIERADEVYYWESDNEYHYEPEEDSEQYTRDYHNGSYKIINFSEEPKFYIGYEIEKEDQEVKESIYISDFEDELPKWRKERDGSLDDNKGYELISPTFELNTDKIFEHIESSETLKNHINAEKSLNCGGHINISQKDLTGEELFNRIQGYTPLFHALYYKRLDKTYTKGKSNKELISSGEKYQSVKIHDNRVEYRIISAVDNINTLKWRTKLMVLILENQTDCPQKAFFNYKTIFSDLIKEMYTGEKLENLEKRIIKYSLQFEDISIVR